MYDVEHASLQAVPQIVGVGLVGTRPLDDDDGGLVNIRVVWTVQNIALAARATLIMFEIKGFMVDPDFAKH